MLRLSLVFIVSMFCSDVVADFSEVRRQQVAEGFALALTDEQAELDVWLDASQTLVFDSVEMGDYGLPLTLVEPLAKLNIDQPALTVIALYVTMATYHAIYIETELPVYRLKAAAYLELWQEFAAEFVGGRVAGLIEPDVTKRKLGWSESLFIGEDYVADSGSPSDLFQLKKTIREDMKTKAIMSYIKNDRLPLVMRFIYDLPRNHGLSESGVTLLMTSIAENKPEAVKLFAALSNCNQTDYQGDDAYDYIAKLGHEHLRSILESSCKS
ncbi:ankyrin repeat domain-containing protein [Simiduia agarivorans]|uniref:Uncharacterized protein n=1 Tax=Simiduia agarivorans (strain DSM 21679 / JCM 13881 / BCRC 17597 / SA1) TaxID=1117647 RepID=K4KGN9_SIMAS|nr:ankyrin repeat domain-containing protein [Simiduia agarivorans]AFU97370.1 hypothetical protein M5M_00675 [Simiduia agarivorans SA1 = DSM 21679]